MSNRDWKLLFYDIIESIDKITDYTKNIDFEKFISSSLITDAVTRNLEIIGEAANKIPDEIKKILTDVPWEQIRGIRNRIIHNYFGVDLNIIWYIVEKELLPLKSSLKDYLENNN